MKSRKTFLSAFFITFAIGLSFLGGYSTHMFFVSRGESFPVLREAAKIFQEHALEPIPDSKTLEYDMIRGMLESYGDPFTTFIEPVQHELQTDELEGKFGGIGVRLERDREGQFLLYPFPDGPAAIAGIKNQDRLLFVDEMAINSETTLEAVQAAIRGPVGKRVRITIIRQPGDTSFEFSIRREDVPLPSVTWRQVLEDPRVGVIKINILAETTPDEINRAVADLTSQGSTYFILDLRDNGGGLLEAGIETARLFLESGTLITQQYRGEPEESFSLTKVGPLNDIPLVVLVNHNTASAAEIVAGTLQANERAKLIGQTTFGKNSIQLVFELQDGSSLHVTAARWWLPSRNGELENQGIIPDIQLEDSVEPSQAVVIASQVLMGIER